MLRYIVCILASLFYLYEFVLQVSPSVITSELMRDLQLNSTGLGVMAAFYYYSYTLMQIPAGLLYDHRGPRLLITIALLICASGALFFGMTHGVAMASAGRFFMGIGSSFAFIGSLVLIAHWFSARYFALLAGVVQLMSSIGAIAGQAPLAKIIEHTGWRQTMIWLAVIGFILAALVALIVRDRPEEQTSYPLPTQPKGAGVLKHLRSVTRKTQTWHIALFSFASWAPITAFAALWGVPYLVTTYGISTTAASSACSMIWLGIAFGSPFIGWWSNHIGIRRLPLIVVSVFGVLSLLCILYFPPLPIPILYLMLFLFGIAASGQSLAFALVKDINHLSSVGTAIGFNNMAVVAGGALLQPLIGMLLHYYWNGAMLDNAPVFQRSDYQIAMFVLPCCYLLGIIICSFFIKETYCRSLCDEDAVKV